jgi:stage III sporulation protein SpoIIIAA
MRQQKITDDLEALLQVLPPPIDQALGAANQGDDLLEIIMDLGRQPEARFVDHELVLSQNEVTAEDLAYVTSRVSEFTSDNRAGIERTLHRISCIRNRQGRVIGLTCRVGRAVYGVVDIVEDIVQSGKNLLLLGRPGVGKTTLLREAARNMGNKKRTVVVDTSNEIGGDGDIPHPAIGRARRMQVAAPELQHEVMIEAVENHMPQVIVIDEIGRQQEAAAARTIAERGVQLIGTAHGNSLENLLLNPTLSDLVGGIESVTLSDEEARRRGTQKTVLERRAPPTFDVLIEIQDRQRMAVHHSVAAAVDALLRGRPLSPEIRYCDESGEVHVIEGAPMALGPELRASGAGGRVPFDVQHTPPVSDLREEAPEVPEVSPLAQRLEKALRIYPYGIGRSRLEQAAENLKVPIAIVDGLNQADAVFTIKNYYRKHPAPISDAERQRIPVYVLRANTLNQMESYLGDLFGVPVQPEDPMDRAVQETQEAIRRILAGSGVEELRPAPADIRRMQHDMARAADLVSHSYGNEPRRRVRIFAG